MTPSRDATAATSPPAIQGQDQVATSPAHTATRLRTEEGARILPSLEGAEAASTEAQGVAGAAADLTEAVAAAVDLLVAAVDLQEVDLTSSFRFV